MAMEPVKLRANSERIAKVRTKIIMAAPHIGMAREPPKTILCFQWVRETVEHP